MYMQIYLISFPEPAMVGPIYPDHFNRRFQWAYNAPIFDPVFDRKIPFLLNVNSLYY